MDLSDDVSWLLYTLLCVVVFIVGLLECLYGYLLLRVSLTFTGFVFADLVYLQWFAPQLEMPSLPHLVVLILVGLLGAFLFTSFRFISIIVIAAFGGASLAAVIHLILVFALPDDAHAYLPTLWQFVLVSSIVASLWSQRHPHTAVVWSTAFIGAWMMMRALGSWLDAWPWETDADFNGWPYYQPAGPHALFWALIVATFVLARFGVYWQTTRPDRLPMVKRDAHGHLHYQAINVR